MLLRHGVAEDAGPATGHRDEPRALTPEGIAKMEAAARGMAALRLVVDGVVTSPLVRCRQTAGIVGAALGATWREDRRLRPGARLDAVEDVLIEHPDAEALMLCGHQPDLSLVVAELTGGAHVEFRKGSLALLEVTSARPGGGVLRALYPPAALRRIGEPAG
ncbi:MAG: histidine phosphatase family protein [Thermoleophilia bacterium]